MFFSSKKPNVIAGSALALVVLAAAPLALADEGEDQKPGRDPGKKGGCRCEVELREKGPIRRLGCRTVTESVREGNRRRNRFRHADCRYTANFARKPRCRGKCAPRKRCKAKVTYSWSITDSNPAGSATIIQGAGERRVTVRVTGTPAAYTLKVKVTVQCQCDGKDAGPPSSDEAEQEFRFRSDV